MLFWDQQLSSDNTIACGTCHSQAGGDVRLSTYGPVTVHPGPDGRPGTADDIRGSVGMVRADSSGRFFDDGLFYPLRQVTRRKSPTTIMAAYAPLSLWDGRAGDRFLDPETGEVAVATGGATENQVLEPLISFVEMASMQRTINDVVLRVFSARPLRLAATTTPDIQAALAAAPDYPALFERAFGTPAVTGRRIAFALATYLRTLATSHTPWDVSQAPWEQGVSATPLTANQTAGWNLFRRLPSEGGAGCAQCHAPPLFTDHSFRNTGVRPAVEDRGRMGITRRAEDRGRFKVPSLRNVGLRGSFFHTGGQVSLQGVVDFYDRGGDFSDNRDPAIQPLHLSPQQKLQLVEFLYYGLLDPRVGSTSAGGSPPFDQPTLRQGQPGGPTYGLGSPGTASLVPEIVPFAIPVTGQSFTVGVGRARQGAPALLVLGLARGSGLPFPINGGTFPLNVGLNPSPFLIPTTISGVSGADGPGVGSVSIRIPSQPLLVGLQFYAQWVIDDPWGSGSAAASRGAQFTVF
jgi:cytochrome c peroxidase